MTRPGDRAPTTYHDLARKGLDPLAPPVSTEVPKQPPNSPWSGDIVPKEEPVGTDANAVDDMTKVQR
jgi:hypothetical protein